MSDTKKTKYYALIDHLYYRLFSIEENYGLTNPKNNYIKWSTVFEPKRGRILRTDQYTIHPEKTQLKTTFVKGTRLVGSYYQNKNVVRDDGSIIDYQPMEVIGGYNTLRECLFILCSSSTNQGFSLNKGHLKIGPDDVSFNFPDDTYRPYWISSYFTKYNLETIKRIFIHEDLNEPILYEGRRGNIVTFLKFLTPEWERLKLPRGDDEDMGHWLSPHFQLSARYHITIPW